MAQQRESSRARFERYREDLRRRFRAGETAGPAHAHGSSAHGGTAHGSSAHGGHGQNKKQKKRLRSSKQLVLSFWQLLGQQRAEVLFSLGTLTIATILALVPPAATKFVVDYVLTDEPMPASLRAWLGGTLPESRFTLLWWTVAVVTAVAAVKILFHVTGRWVATRATKRMQFSVRRKVFDHAVRLPLHRVHALKSGGVASVLRVDAGAVADLIFGMMYNPWRAVIQLAGSLCVLAWIDWRLLLGALLLLPVVFFTHRTWINRIRPQFRDIRARREEVDAQATETFGGMRVVRAFSRQRSEAGRFMRGNHLMGRQELMAWWWSRTIEIVWELLLPLASGAVLLYGGWQVLEGNLTLGDLMMFLVYLLMLLDPLATLAQSAAQFQNSLSGLDRVLDLLDEDRDMPAGPQARSVRAEEVTGELVFEDVTFAYSGSPQPALQGISLTARAGEVVALVGPSGAGKTTLCNLAARFYDPTSGRILLDGTDLRDIDVESYRTLLGIVEQDVFLFDGTVAENIGYANRHASDELLQEAARAANAEEFIVDLPDGYDTLIGERGVRLSGGQRQRLAIARAILADPRILILDEATSNLDTHSERLIQQSFGRLMAGRTTFVIAHRLSTIMHADRILVLDGGRIIEAGTHEELLAAGGSYTEMVRMQTSGHQQLIQEPAGERDS